MPRLRDYLAARKIPVEPLRGKGPNGNLSQAERLFTCPATCTEEAITTAAARKRSMTAGCNCMTRARARAIELHAERRGDSVRSPAAEFDAPLRD